jgi:hypothetical protein
MKRFVDIGSRVQESFWTGFETGEGMSILVSKSWLLFPGKYIHEVALVYDYVK